MIYPHVMGYVLKSGNCRLCVSHFGSNIKLWICAWFLLLHNVHYTKIYTHTCCVFMLNKLRCNVCGFYMVHLYITTSQGKKNEDEVMYVSWKGGFYNEESVVLYWNYTTYFYFNILVYSKWWYAYPQHLISWNMYILENIAKRLNINVVLFYNKG